MDPEKPLQPTQDPSPPAKPQSPSKRVRLAVLVLAALVLGGGMAALVLNLAIDRIRAGPPGPPTRTVVVPTLPPEWTPTPTPIATPTRTPGPTQPTTPSSTPDTDPANTARQLMHDQHYAEAIETWTKVIDAAPEDHAAYYGRASSYLRLTRGLRDRDLVIEYSQSALDDADRALALSPELNGDYYLARGWAL